MPASHLHSSRRSSCVPPQIAKWTIALSLLGTLPAAAQQQTNDLQNQLQEIKQQYEQTTRELQQRIAALEQQIQRQSADQKAAELELSERLSKEEEDKARQKQEVVSAAQLAAEQAARKFIFGQSNEVGSKFQEDVPYPPTYDLVQEAGIKIQKLQNDVGSFEFHGYFRSGYGLNSEGGQQVTFQAPGSGAKYRLGNEAETYSELIFVNNWLNPDRSFDKAWMKTEFLIEANTTNSTSYPNFPNGVGNDQFRLREAFVQGGNILAGYPNAKFWAGERYYRRQHVEINDFYPLDMSGYGGGIEDLHLGIGNLAVAYLAGARPDIITQNGIYAKSNLDARFYGVKVPGGDGAVWFDFATAKGGTTPTGLVIPTTNGYAFGLRHERLEWHGGYNWAAFSYGRGAASNYSTSLDDPTSTLGDSDRFLFTEQCLLQPNDQFAIMPIFIYQRTHDGNPSHGANQWISFGARPEVFFSKYISLAFEGGADYTSSDQAGYEGWLRKFTIAPQIGAGRKFTSRPALRVFLTYANWSSGFRGLVGGVPYADRTNGLTYGVQTETWW
jgi:maltoporin